MNVVCCFGTDTPTPELAESCARHHLFREVAENRPRVVVLMGAVATSLVPEIDLEIQHGIPLRANWKGRQIVIFPMWHPASGLHNTRMMVPLRRDFEALGRLLSGRLVIPTDTISNPVYEELATGAEVDDRTRAAGRYDPLAMDTETLTLLGREFWCLTFSLEPGTGFMVRSREAIKAFRKWLREHRGIIIFHNWLFDVPVLASVGCSMLGHRMADTMVMAYHLGDLPQGLKALASRPIKSWSTSQSALTRSPSQP